jgi:hypothetical protein
MRIVSFCLSLWPALAMAAPTVSITAPVANSMQSQSLAVKANVTPGMALLTKVQASIGNQTVDMGFTGGNTYTATITIAGNVPFGMQTLSVTAYDSMPSQTTASVTIVHDEPPQITLEEVPINAYLPPNPAHYKVDCSDDGPMGCTTFEFLATVGQQTTMLTSGTTQIDAMVDFGPFADQLVFVQAHIADSGGHDLKLNMGRDRYFVTNAPALCQYAAPIGPKPNVQSPDTPFDEPVFDADETRVLTNKHIIDRANGGMIDELLLGGVWTNQWMGMLIPGGTISGQYDFFNGGRSGTVNLPNGFVPGGSDTRLSNAVFSAFGNYILPWDGNRLFDISMPGAPMMLGVDTGPQSWSGSGDSTNGNLCLVSQNVINLVGLDGKVKSSIALDNSISLYECVVDDGNIVYRFTTPGLPGPKNHAGLAMIDKMGAPATLIAEAYTTRDQNTGLCNMPLTPPSYNGQYSYGVVGDWVFYWSNGQIWQRSPQGITTAVSSPLVGTDYPYVIGMSPTGELLVGGSPDSTNSLYGLHRVPGGSMMSGATLVRSDPFGNLKNSLQPIWRGGRWILVEGDFGLNSPSGGAWLFNDGMAKPYDCLAVIVAPDGGVAGDAAAPNDAAISVDAAVALDASLPSDAAIVIDAAVALDGSLSPDAAMGNLDSAVAVDARQPPVPDAAMGGALDSAVAVDARQPPVPDAATAHHDAGAPAMDSAVAMNGAVDAAMIGGGDNASGCTVGARHPSGGIALLLLLLPAALVRRRDRG